MEKINPEIKQKTIKSYKNTGIMLEIFKKSRIKL